MDPFSIVAGVVGVSGAAIRASSSLYELIESVRNAPAEISAVSKDAHAFNDVISSLEMTLSDSTVGSVLKDDENVIKAIKRLERPLANCLDIIEQVDAKLRSHLKPIAGGGWRVSNLDVKWYFTRGEVKDLVTRLESTKQTLDAALSTVVLVCTIRTAGRDRNSGPYPDIQRHRQRRPSDTDTDAGFALKRYAASIAAFSTSLSGAFDERMTTSETKTTEMTPSDSISTREGASPLVTQEPLLTVLERLQKEENQRAGLHDAARHGDDLILEIMLVEGTDVDIRAADGRTALHLIAENGNEAGAKILLDHGANVDAVSYTGGTSMERKFRGGRTPLHWAAEHRQMGIIRLLIEAGADLGIRNASGRSALQESIGENGDATSRMLIEAGAPLSMKDDEGWTALHQAAQDGRIEIVEILLDKGVDLEAIVTDQNIWNLEDTGRATPLLLAVIACRHLTVQYLISRGANIRAENVVGDQPIHIACRKGYLRLVKIFLDAGVDIETRESAHNETPLLKAASTGKTDVVMYLMEKGADTKAKTQHGRNALVHSQLHQRGRHEETVLAIKEWMQQHGQAEEVKHMLLPQYRNSPSPSIPT
ncbi:MAG: hypothetical protein Q9164_005185 [Protoblastenia rupestris]